MTAGLKRRATVRDVADMAQVSRMTVCRVIHGSGLVAAATQERVRIAIRRLKYRPDPALSALAAYRTNRGGTQHGSMLAFLDCDGSEYSQLVLDGARREAELLGYGVAYFRLKPDPASQARLSRLLYSRGIRGVMFGPSEVAWEFSGWTWPHFVPVSLGAIHHRPAMNAVCMDYFDASSSAVSYLRQMGCRRLAFIVSPDLQSRTADRWIGGFATMLVDGEGVVYRGKDFKNSLRRWVRYHQPDGIITIHRAAWDVLRPMGKRFVFLNSFECPDRVDYVSLDTRRIGSEGVRLLHHHLLRRDFGLPSEAKMLSLQGGILRR